MRADTTLFMVAIVLVAATAGGEPGASCAQIDDDAQRLACYDRGANRTASADGTAGVAPESTKDSDSADVSGESLPKSSRDERSAEDAFGVQQRPSEDAELEQIHAVVTEVVALPGNKRQFNLDNGQIWLETSTTTRLRLSPGDSIRIKRGAFGSYRLFGTGKTSTRVTRQK